MKLDAKTILNHLHNLVVEKKFNYTEIKGGLSLTLNENAKGFCEIEITRSQQVNKKLEFKYDVKFHSFTERNILKILNVDEFNIASEIQYYLNK